MPTDKDAAVLTYIAAHPGAGRESIRRATMPQASPTSVWRVLNRLVEEGDLEVSGKARATGYTIAGSAFVVDHLKTPYNQRPVKRYDPSFLDRYLPNRSFYLDAGVRRQLHEAGGLSLELPAGTYARRILERLLIDLSWASSRMEGNTYDILDTEQLVRFGREVTGKDRKEAVMILNHKEAIEYVVESLNEISISRVDTLNIHALLADDLLVDPATAGRLRRLPVGIGHSSYRPLDDALAIVEEFEIFIAKATTIVDPFEQSFFLIVHLPYLQPFADANKRTSRIASNIPLLKADLAPMSFTTMDDRAYIDGLIGVYELNNVSLLRDAYVAAYLTSAENYKVVAAEVAEPDRLAVEYRDFIREAVRRCVLEAKHYDQEHVLKMMRQSAVPEADRIDLAAYVRKQFEGLHEGNAIRYRLRAEDLREIGRHQGGSRIS